MNQEAQLRDRIDELEEEVRQLKALLLPTDWEQFDIGIHFPPQQHRILVMLYTRVAVTGEQIKSVLGMEGEDPDNQVTVLICAIRRRLRCTDVLITTRRGPVYSIDDENKAKLKALLLSRSFVAN